MEKIENLSNSELVALLTLCNEVRTFVSKNVKLETEEQKRDFDKAVKELEENQTLIKKIESEVRRRISEYQ